MVSMTQAAAAPRDTAGAAVSERPMLATGASGAYPAQDIVLRAEGLSKRYGAQIAVKDVSFEVYAGEVFGFLGPNGAGKSTTIAMILGLIAPTAGRIELFGLGPERRPEALARVGAIIETPSFYPYLSGFDNLSIMGALRGGIPASRIREVLELVGLSDAAGRQFSKYSLGMKQRLGIASTLMHDPALVILDEPTNGLDPAGIIEVRELIRKLADYGKTVFISSHLLNEVEQVCDRVAILRQGEVIAAGRISELLGSGTQVVVRIDQPARGAELLRNLDGGEPIEERPGELLVTGAGVRPADIAATLVSAGIELDELRRVSSSLEHIFLELTSDNENEVHING